MPCNRDNCLQPNASAMPPSSSIKLVSRWYFTKIVAKDKMIACFFSANMVLYWVI